MMHVLDRTQRMRAYTRGLAAVALAGAIGAFGCRHSDAPKQLRLQSPVGNKVPSVSELMRDRPLLEDLDPAELEEEFWVDGAEAHRGPGPSALSVGSDERIALEFRAKPLGNVVSTLGDIAGVNIVFDASLAQPIDASFPSVTVGEALYSILEQQQMELLEDPPGVYSVRSVLNSPQRLRSFKLTSISASGAAVAATAIVGQDATIVTDAGQNLLFVRGSRDAILAVEQYLTRADKLEPQVLIEVHILEAIVDEEFELGVTHAIDGSIAGNAFDIVQNLATPNARRFSGIFDFAGGDIQSASNAIQTYVDL